MGVSYWPRSPENTSLRRPAPSVTHSSTLDEPRMCPASRTRTVKPGSNSRGVSYAMPSTWRSTASTSSRSNSGFAALVHAGRRDWRARLRASAGAPNRAAGWAAARRTPGWCRSGRDIRASPATEVVRNGRCARDSGPRHRCRPHRRETTAGCARARPHHPGSCRSPAGAGARPLAGCDRNLSLLPPLQKLQLHAGDTLTSAHRRTR